MQMSCHNIMMSPQKSSGSSNIYLLNPVRKRKGKDNITVEDLQEFLNSTPRRGEYRKGDVRSLWSAMRKLIKNQLSGVEFLNSTLGYRKGDVTSLWLAVRKLILRTLSAR